MNHAQFWGGAAAPYEIEQSLRFNSGDSTYLNRTPSSAGDRTLWTWSAWVKRSAIGSTVGLFGSYAAANNTDYLEILFASGNTLLVQGNNQVFLETSQVFRDTSAWYHIVIAVDTSNATADDRIKIYVNGEQVTAFATRNNPGSGVNLGVNQAGVHRLGRRPNGTDYFNGYMAEVNFIDGSALAPTDFGEPDDNGVWRPKRYTGSYTGNSFYLKFASGDGTDSSGLSNTWTASGFTTSGTGTDVMSDTPTTNFCTWNPLFKQGNSPTYSEANLVVGGNPGSPILGTIGVSSGKWYWEVKPSGASSLIGICGPVLSSYSGNLYDQSTAYCYTNDGRKGHSGSLSSYAASYTGGDIIGVALDLDAGTLVFYKNGTSQGTAFTSISGTFFPAVSDWGTNISFTLNCGQRAFEQTVPTGYSALNTANLPAPDIANGSDYFDTFLYNGTNSSSASNKTGNFTWTPDFVWIKNRNGANSHRLVDAVRGTGISLISNSTGSEVNSTTYAPTAFISGGYTTQTSDNSINGLTSDTYVAWNWLAGNGTSSNTDGSITSTVSANPTAGFSIVSYTGNSTDNATVGHGLGVEPSFYCVKNRDTAVHWGVWHKALTDSQILRLSNNTAATTPATAYFQPENNSNTVISLGTNNETNELNDTYIAYCFTDVEGYSKFGSYDGNGSTDGTFVYCGFKPAWLMIKRYDSLTNNWFIVDSVRDTYNVVQKKLEADNSVAESSITDNELDILSNGFKLRRSTNGTNGSGASYVFAAFASHPFGGDGVSPATAR